jgi:dTDP-4-amino-4,6-dideoxygalactose transaminase
MTFVTTAIARERDLIVIENACHGLGSSFTTSFGETSLAGDCRFADTVAFSFHPVKNVMSGEGGAVTTNGDEFVRWMRLP